MDRKELGPAALVLGSCVAWLVSGLMPAAAQSQPRDTMSIAPVIMRASADTAPVDIVKDEVRLRIPRNHILTANLSYSYMRGSQRFGFLALEIVATYPGFAGATAETIRSFAPGGVNDTSVNIFVHDPKAQNAVEQRYGPAVAEASRMPGAGLKKVSTTSKVGSPDLFDVYVADDVNPVAVLDCPKEGRGGGRACEVSTTRCGLPVMYRFHNKHLAQWREIRDGVDRMFRSFCL